ncbi:DUF2267 domain-containing protein [Rhizobium sp. P38BS-XIX]|uniref:DUF2267 domain-containing protein n=1 Tax=Rhizobium sp. P38BS-XIX TaxID=2726740 RepID=UPI0014573B0F|nr:DUF2267 domain-containing protein [Rhizobium sp. P38BS-XIX]NLR95684.1 DUF2267 domain-containing protein [Rhizobium sp. P38BS-XIX]
MTVPMRYSRATEEFDAFLRDAQIHMDTATRHQTYQGVYGTLIVFRRRLMVQQVIDFAAVLPAVLGAILVSDWDTREPPRPFESREAMTSEVLAVRQDHNLAPRSVISDVAAAMRGHVDPIAFDQCLQRLGPDSMAFWGAPD